MKFKNLLNFDDERAVSPVIGVILMVAITVILAAVIGTFVLGLGDQVQETAPNSQFTFDWDNNHQAGDDDELEITHDGGDGIASNELAVRASGAQDYDETDGYSAIEQGTADEDIYLFEPETVRAGTSATLEADNFDIEDTDELALNGTTVRVVWEDADSDRSSTIRTWTGPDA